MLKLTVILIVLFAKLGGGVWVETGGTPVGSSSPGFYDGSGTIQGGGGINVQALSQFGSVNVITLDPHSNFNIYPYSQVNFHNSLSLTVTETGVVIFWFFNWIDLRGSAIVAGKLQTAYSCRVTLEHDSNSLTIPEGGEVMLGSYVVLWQSSNLTLLVYGSLNFRDTSSGMLNGQLTVKKTGRVDVESSGHLLLGSNCALTTSGNIGIGPDATLNVNSNLNLQQSGSISMGKGSEMSIDGNIRLIIPTHWTLGERSRLRITSANRITCVSSGDVNVEEFTAQEYVYPNTVPDALNSKLFCFPSSKLPFL